MANFIRKGEWLEYHVSSTDQGKTIEEVCMSKFLISGRMLQKLTRHRGIQINGKKSYLAYPLKKGDRLQIKIFEWEEYGVEPEATPLEVLYEDDHVLVVNKPAGVAVHPTEPNQRGTLAHAIAFYYQTKGLQTKVRHIHRLDKDTTGAILIAKHSLAQSILDKDLRERKISREYLAIVSGIPEPTQGTIDEPIGRDRHHPTRRRVSKTGDRAVTHYEVLETMNNEAALVKLYLDTGRTHQIRVHMSHIGHPLFGDFLYDGPMKGIQRQALHAAKLTFFHPFTLEKITVDAPMPEDMEQLLILLHSNA
ncbi:RluA family pseudouridine synthase [Tepidibacillus fermentans]|uniref:Pseudouridine synthase n=1 Tax=Tepidibacillus fermentans TaxID=1281767 RepID=A0A4V2USZ3_9BACI|nr:RluA family pseudouridine synthase [Tepidibacillus fermentans]TCS83384.1 23S rRNA pseudouridine1911/1915/1917 synthase [Tepidibacillus fermentans]